MNFVKWLRIIIYFIQTIISCYLLFWYLPSNITSEKPESCTSTSTSDNVNEFFYGWIDKCDIAINADSRKYIKLLFYFIGFIKLIFDVIMLFMLFAFNANSDSNANTNANTIANTNANSIAN